MSRVFIENNAKSRGRKTDITLSDKRKYNLALVG